MNNIQVYIIHRWSGGPDTDWYPWLAAELEKRDIQTFRLKIPHTDEPTIEDSVAMVKDAISEPHKNTYLVTHSIGGQIALRYAQEINTPLGGAVMVAPWFNLLGIEDEEPEDQEIARPWLEEPINYAKVKENLPHIVALFSDNDPHVPDGDKDLFEQRLNAHTIVVPKAGHFTKENGFTELPLARDELFKMIQ